MAHFEAEVLVELITDVEVEKRLARLAAHNATVKAFLMSMRNGATIQDMLIGLVMELSTQNETLNKMLVTALSMQPSAFTLPVVHLPK